MTGATEASVRPFAAALCCAVVVGCTLFAGVWAPGCARVAREPATGLPEDATLAYEISPVLPEVDDPSSWRVSHEFVFRNPFDEPLKLSLLDVSCGCAECTILTPIVAPGRPARVSLAYDVKYARERRIEQAIISTGVEQYPKLTLALIADV